MIHILALGLTAAIWGFGYIATKWTLVDYGPHWANAARFVIALVVSLPFLIPSFRKGWKHIAPGLWIGVLLFLGVLWQTIGLDYTSVAKSGFFTSLYVVMIPIAMILFYKESYSRNFWLFLVLAMSGIALLCEFSFRHFNIGDFYTLLCAAAFAAHIIVVGRITHRYKPFELNALQILMASFLGVISSLYFEGPFDFSNLYNESVWEISSPLMGFIYLGLGSSFLAFSMQNLAQKYIATHVSGMIFLLESPFGTLFAFLVLKEYLSLVQIFGCALILIAVLGVSVFSKKVRKLKRKKIKRFRIPFR